MLSWLKLRSERTLFLPDKFRVAWFFFPWGFAIEIDSTRRLELRLRGIRLVDDPRRCEVAEAFKDGG
jgi:hypothetical protein